LLLILINSRFVLTSATARTTVPDFRVSGGIVKKAHRVWARRANSEQRDSREHSATSDVARNQANQLVHKQTLRALISY